MTRTIALAFLLAALGSGGPASAGKYNGDASNHNLPTSFSQTPRDCSGPQYHGLHNPCAPTEPTVTPTPGNPHGGCGYYGPNGVLIRCR